MLKETAPEGFASCAVFVSGRLFMITKLVSWSSVLVVHAAPAAPVAEDKARKVFVSRDGVEQGTFWDYDLAYAELGNPTWAGAVVYDTAKKIYVPAREYLLPF